MALGEFGRIARFFRPLAQHPGALELADDAAVLAVPPGHDLVVTTDAMVAGVHFLPDDPPADIAAKLMRVNLSDLAAMGAEPFGCTLVTALPRAIGDGWVEAFAAGLGADQTRFGLPLLGGDSVSTDGPVTLSLTAFGLVPPGTALTRRCARADATLFVTGTIGDAALGLDVALGLLTVPPPDAAHLIGRLRRPEPRLALGVGLRGVALAAVDISDGLIADLGHLCQRSGCAAVVDTVRVPLSAAARRAVTQRPELMERVLTGGDDYELLVAALDHSAIAARSAQHGVPITEIGRLVPGPPGEVTAVGADGAPVSLSRTGWVHF